MSGTAARGEGLLVLAPLRLEARAIRSSAPRATVLRVGVGPAKARLGARRARLCNARAVAVAGFCGALDPTLTPGDIVVAAELRSVEGLRSCPAAAALVEELEALGIPVRLGSIVSLGHMVRGAERRHLAATGALAVDMESAWLAEAAAGRPLVVLRSVLDTEDRELLNPLATVTGGLRAYRALARASGALAAWASELAESDTVWTAEFERPGAREPCRSP
jgi:4-hydroxy-3-methylbut-2-en-1-yl diphosphate reductase